MSANGDEDTESRAERLRRKARQDVRAGRRAARDAAANVRRKGRQDLRAAERAARRKAADVKRKAQQDVDAAERRARSTSARELLAGVADRVGGGGGESVEAPDSTREVVARAGDAAGVRAPMNASLDPGADGPALESFARASPMREERGGQPSQGDETDAAMLDDGFIVGDEGEGGGFEGLLSGGGGGGDDADGDDDPLAFDDAFDATGGDDEVVFF